MFLADQHSAIKAQDPEVKLLDLVGNAIKEWDQTESLRDEYSAKSLEEAMKYDSLIASSMKPADLPQPQFTFQLDANGKPIPPKRPLSAFFLFKLECFDQVKRENPDLRIIELTKLISERWLAADPQLKSQYGEKAIQAKQLYEQQIAAFEAMYGKIEKKSRVSRLGGTGNLIPSTGSILTGPFAGGTPATGFFGAGANTVTGTSGRTTTLSTDSFGGGNTFTGLSGGTTTYANPFGGTTTVTRTSPFGPATITASGAFGGMTTTTTSTFTSPFGGGITTTVPEMSGRTTTLATGSFGGGNTYSGLSGSTVTVPGPSGGLPTFASPFGGGTTTVTGPQTGTTGTGLFGGPFEGATSNLIGGTRGTRGTSSNVLMLNPNPPPANDDSSSDDG